MILKQSLSALILTTVFAFAPHLAAAEGYKLTVLAANKQVYAPQIVDKHMVNAWGLAIRPAGAGGHFWVNNTDSGTVSLYVGDTADRALYQDSIPFVTIAQPKHAKEAHSAPTGQVFNGNENEFIITQDDLTAPSKFIFCTEGGTISGWTERKNPDGTFTRPKTSLLKVDNSKQHAIYKGLAISNKPDGNRLYAADFGRKHIDVFDNAYRPLDLGKTAFALPQKSIPAGFAPFNVQELGGSLYVAYAKLSKEAGEEQKGEGFGYVAEFDYDGKFIRLLDGGKLLNAPWGLALAPEKFGKYSGVILVGNFGDGHI